MAYKPASGKTNPPPPANEADRLFILYNELVKTPQARLIHLLAIPVLIFSVMGLLWVVPFPHLGLLGHYNGFINWASFFIAILVYYYLRTAPSVSYILLLYLLLCAYGVTALVTYQATGQLRVWVPCLTLLVMAFTACALTSHSSRGYSLRDKLRLPIAAPLWQIRWLSRKLKK